MLPPIENALAADPPSERAGNVTLRPLTLRGAIRLAAEGIDVGRRVPDDMLFPAAFVLSGETDRRRFVRRARCGLAELSAAVERVLDTAFSTFIKPQKAANGTVSLTPSGIGWPLEYAEWLCAEYGWGWQTALDTPVVTVYALSAACRQRNGGKHAGFDYIQRRYNEDVKAGRVKPVKPFDR